MPLSKYDIQVDLENRKGTSHAILVEMVGANKRVLDVGCDTGYLGEALGAFGNQTSGFEVNEVAAAGARERLVRVEVGDLETTDLVSLFGEAGFDVVIFGDVLEHLRDPLQVLRQARRLLAPGGSALISTPNVAHGDVRLALLQGRFNYTKVGILDETHTRFFTVKSFADFVHDAGFVIADLRRTFAPLFATEVGVREEDFDPTVVAALRDDTEATTYQFVARVVPDNISTLESAQALRLDELSQRLTAEQNRHAAEASELSRQIGKLAGDLAASERERQHLSAELAAVRATPPPSLARRALSRARRALR